MTAWWAGPCASHLLALFGAEVIHLESAGRPDGLRMVGGMMAAHYGDWWEASTHFLHVNTNKLDLTLDLSKPKGRELVEKLIGECDAVIENFTPRVIEGFGLTWERVRELNPEALMMRMPAFGLTGPWRDNTGFAQTMEQLSGLAWVTGHVDDQPRIPRGPCDPLAGMHGAVAFLVALAERGATGRGHHVESTMVESALNVAAEQVIEWSAYSRLLHREGNRSPLAAPQGLYPCADGQPLAEKWLALSIATEDQWRALCRALGDPEWVRRSPTPADCSKPTPSSSHGATSRLPSTRWSAPCPCPLCPSATRASNAGSEPRRPQSASTTSACCAGSSACPPRRWGSSPTRA
jgi:crotonobetainyl-CoA:carnitine CoA-transferase CaiB-like acyl-CoA transferase